MKRRSFLSTAAASFCSFPVASFGKNLSSDNSKFNIVVKDDGCLALFENNLEIKTLASPGQIFHLKNNVSESFIYKKQVSINSNDLLIFIDGDAEKNETSFYFSKLNESTQELDFESSLHSEKDFDRFDQLVCIFFENIGPRFEYLLLLKSALTSDLKFIGFEKSSSQFVTLNSLGFDSFSNPIDDFTTIGQLNSEMFSFSNPVLLFQWNGLGQSYFKLSIDDSSYVTLEEFYSRPLA